MSFTWSLTLLHCFSIPTSYFTLCGRIFCIFPDSARLVFQEARTGAVVWFWPSHYVPNRPAWRSSAPLWITYWVFLGKNTALETSLKVNASLCCKGCTSSTCQKYWEQKWNINLIIVIIMHTVTVFTHGIESGHNSWSDCG